MSPQHDDLVLKVRPGDLCHRVISHEILVVKLDRQVDRHLQFHALLAHADQAIVMFLREDDLRDDLGGVFVIRRDTPLAG